MEKPLEPKPGVELSPESRLNGDRKLLSSLSKSTTIFSELVLIELDELRSALLDVSLK